jgi:alpha-galactosidase
MYHATAARGRSIDLSATGLVLRSADEAAGLCAETVIEAVAGGSVRFQHSLTNLADDEFCLDWLRVHLPLPAGHLELLTFADRELWERVPHRHPIGDGTFARDNRRGRLGHENATVRHRPDRLRVHPPWSGAATAATRSSATRPAP